MFTKTANAQTTTQTRDVLGQLLTFDSPDGTRFQLDLGRSEKPETAVLNQLISKFAYFSRC